MGYNKKRQLQANILAIQTVFELERLELKPSYEQIHILKQYSGFGGLKCILRPCANPQDIDTWNKSEQDLFEDTRRLYEVIRQYSDTENEYKSYVDSLQKSILSAFYTPNEVTDVIAKALSDSGIRMQKVLDPSAGIGAFMQSFESYTAYPIVAYEKDWLTAKILKAIHSDSRVFGNGFETLRNNFLNHFDIVSSNIPFGDFSVFDPIFSDSKDKIRYQACKAIHNYFFLKAVDAVREGGLIAFITSQGVMNSTNNTSVREWLVKQCNFITAIRLPNNLFLDIANTEAGSDLIIFQKNNYKTELSEREKAFVEVRTLANGISINNHYMNFSRVVHTDVKSGKDQYGKPAIEFWYDGCMEKLADDLYDKMLVDCKEYIDIDLYNKYLAHEAVAVEKEIYSKFEEIEMSVASETSISLYDLFGIPEEERTQITKKQKTKAGSKVTSSSGDSISDVSHSLEIVITSKEPRLYEGVLMNFYKDGTLVECTGQIGILSIKVEWDYKAQQEKKTYFFNPIKTSKDQVSKAILYFDLRNVYLNLHQLESETEMEYEEEREILNRRYNEFTAEFGDLNDSENKKLIRQDIFGSEILTLESFENGQKKLADIFYHPVAFMSDKRILVEKPDEALAASINKFGVVDLEYMTSISGKDETELINELENIIYYNPLSQSYEISSSFIAGDVIVKSELIQEYIENNPEEQDIAASQKSLEALKQSIPEPILFADLDFNFGERWVPTKFYNEYTSEIFNTEITIEYISDLDNFHIEAKNPLTVEIKEKYAVKPDYSDNIGGITLLSHALVNTAPKISKPSGRYTIDGKEIRIPDLDAIQQANTKIDEIRSGFTDYLNNLPVETKDELADLYNRKFNARVKPQYDGKFQTFTDLQLKALGIDNLYDSQYDTVWMLKSNNGGIVDHEVGAGKTLTICITSHEMKRLKMAHKPMIIGLKTNIFAIADTYRKAYPNDKILYPGEEDFKPKNRLKLFHKIKNNDWDAIILTHEQFFKIPQSLEVQRDILQQELESVEENLRVYERLNKVSASAGMLKGLQKRQENLMAMLRELFHKMEKRRDDTIDFQMMGIDHLFVDESHEFKNLRFDTRYRYISGLGDPQGSQRALNMLYAIRTMQYRKEKDLCATFLSGTTISNSLVELYLLFKYLRPQALETQGIRTFDAWAAVYAKKSNDFEFTVTNEIKSRERFRYFKNVPELAKFYNEITDYRTAKDINIDRPDNNVILYTTRSTPEQDEFQKKLIEFAKTGEGALIGRPEKDYDKKDSGRMLVVTDLARKAALDMRMIHPKLYHDHVDNKLSQAAKKIAEYYYKYDIQRGTQFVFCDIGTYRSDRPHDWSIYNELKRKLVEEYKLHDFEVRFIQEAKNIRQKASLISDFKKGIIRVLMGHTKSLGTGVDAPDKTVATHNIDIPWTPKDMEQRGGRGARKGNLIAKLYADNKVDNFIYASENSLDTYKFNLLQNKQLFITQLKTNSLGKRTIDEGAMDEDGNMNYSEYVAILSGNTDLLDKVKLERKITVVESEQRNYNRQIDRTAWTLKNDLDTIERKKLRLEGMKTDWENIEQNLPENEIGERPNPIRLDNFKYNDDIKAIGERLVEIDKYKDTGGSYTKIGSLLDFNILVKTEAVYGEKFNRFYAEGACKYSYNNGDLAKDPMLAATNFIKALGRIYSIIPKYKEEIEQLEKDTKVMQEIIDTPWRKTEELNKCRIELAALERKIQDMLTSIDKNENRLPESSMVEVIEEVECIEAI